VNFLSKEYSNYLRNALMEIVLVEFLKERDANNQKRIRPSNHLISSMKNFGQRNDILSVVIKPHFLTNNLQTS